MTTTIDAWRATRAEHRKYSARLPRRRVNGVLLLPAISIVVIAIIVPFFLPYSPTMVSGGASEPPSGTHLFGTDSVGFDVLARTIGGARYDLAIAALTTLLCTVIGVVFGLGIGSSESERGLTGLTARGVTRLFDLIQAVPAILIGMVLISFFGPTPTTLVVGMAVILAPIQMRNVRIEVLRVRKEAYLDAARMSGQSELKLMIRHVLPNSTWVALESMSFLFGTSILLMAALGFVGVGLKQPTPEWGSMISAATNDALAGRWWSSAFPSAALLVTVAAFGNASHAFFGRSDRKVADKEALAALAPSPSLVAR